MLAEVELRFGHRYQLRTRDVAERAVELVVLAHVDDLHRAGHFLERHGIDLPQPGEGPGQRRPGRLGR